MDNILDGKFLAETIKQKLKLKIAKLKIKPTLAVILVGNDAASQVYVRNKHKACQEVGINPIQITLPANISEKTLIAKIKSLNMDNTVHGILVQMPLPRHINKDKVIKAIDPKKDVDGMHPNNIGKLMSGYPTFIPCTPAGIIEMLNHVPKYNFEGKNALVIGKSTIVGQPVAQLLLNKGCTVTIAHSKTPRNVLNRMAADSDIIVSAVGRPNILDKRDLVDLRIFNPSDKIIIDAGINRDKNGKLCGDIEESLKQTAMYYTPVPGGVGPMTIAMLLKNTVLAASRGRI